MTRGSVNRISGSKAILPEMLPGHRQRQVTHWVKRKHQDALFARLDLCDALRNRIAHHEPVWKLGPLMTESRARSGKPLIVEEPAPSGPTEALLKDGHRTLGRFGCSVG